MRASRISSRSTGLAERVVVVYWFTCFLSIRARSLGGVRARNVLGGRLDVAHQVASDGIGHEEALPFQSPPLADGDGFNQTPLVEVVGEASTDAEKLGDAVVVEEFRLRGGIREPRCCGGCVLLHGRTISHPQTRFIPSGTLLVLTKRKRYRF